MNNIGQRIAIARRRRGLSQVVLAGLVGRSESWLSQVERGRRGIDSHAVLTRLAEILRVDVSDLTGQLARDETAPGRYGHAAQIEQAMMCYDALAGAIAPPTTNQRGDVTNLVSRAKATYRRYQATGYEEAGRLLPRLIRDVEAASQPDGGTNRQMCRARALVYDTTATLLNRVGEHSLAWVAADRAVTAAAQAADPLLAALGAYRLAYVLPGRRHPQQAVEVALSAAQALERFLSAASAEHLSMYGGLHLAAASAAAATYDQPLTLSLLRTAHKVAERIGGDANFMGTGFGPVNVAIHTMSVSVQLGDAATAISIGESLHDQALPPGLIGRRTQIQLDLARAYAMRRHDAAAVNALLVAEGLSPQLVRFDERTRDLITGLLHREHRASTPQLRPLAHRAGII